LIETGEPDGALAKRGRREEFIAKFEELILSGRFAPGDKLPPERELSLSLGASRPVVHAALGCLASRGLVRIEPRQGVFVADWRREGSVEMLLSIMSYSGGGISPRLFDSLLEARLLFETELARLAASRRSASQLDELERLLARERLFEYREPGDATELDYAFHLGVALASGNDVYPLLMNSLKRIYERILDRFYSDPSVIPEVFALHRELVAAIASRDEAEAAATMRRILEYGERNLRRIIVGSGSKRRAK
jgi:DNA-binding FadR family transcriptional regulator